MFKKYYSISDTKQKRFIIMQDDESGKFAILKSVKPEFVDVIKTVDNTNGLLPQIYEYGEDYIVEEEIDGIKLADKLDITIISFEKIIKVILNVCDALTILHNAGVCHMDVNLENILETSDRFVLIGYSGLAKLGTKTGDVSYGTTGFCSPEHFGFDIIDASTDVYSVGALLKYLLDKSCADNQKKIFDNLIKKSMEFSRRERIQSIEEFKRLFREAINTKYTKSIKGFAGIVGSIFNGYQNLTNVCQKHTKDNDIDDKITIDSNRIPARDLLLSMDNVEDLSRFLEVNDDNFIKVSVADFFNQVMKNKKIKKADVVKDSGIERTYAYQLLNGRKNPSRDKLIQLCIGTKMSFDETQIALKHTGFLPLYPKIRRDCIIIYAIKSKKSIWDIDELLFQFNEDTFNNI